MNAKQLQCDLLSKEDPEISNGPPHIQLENVITFRPYHFLCFGVSLSFIITSSNILSQNILFLL